MTEPNEQSAADNAQNLRRRPSRRLWILSAAGLAVALIAGVILIRVLGGIVEPKTWESIDQVDWTNTTIDLPDNSSNACPKGLQKVMPTEQGKLTAKIGSVESPDPGRVGNLYLFPKETLVADLIGDARPEALVHIQCASGLEPNSYTGAQLLVVTLKDDHTLAGLAYVGPIGAQYRKVSVTDKTITTQVQYWETKTGGTGWSIYAPAHTRTYKWNNTSFLQVSGRSAPLALSNDKYGPGAPTQLAGIMREDGTTACPTAQVRFDANIAEGKYRLGNDPAAADLNDDGNDEIVVSVQCDQSGRKNTSLYVLGQGDDQFFTVDVPFANDGDFELEHWELQGKKLIIILKSTKDGSTTTHDSTWSGTKFEPVVGHYAK